MNMEPAQKKGVTISGVMHTLLIILMIIGLPAIFWSKPDMEEPTAITVDILPIAAMSNVKPSVAEKPVQPTPDKKTAPEPQKDILEKTLAELKEAKEKPAPATKKEEAKPVEPEKVPDPEAPKEEKKEEVKDKKQEPKEDPLDAILKGVKDMKAQDKKAEVPASPAQPAATDGKNRSNNFDPNSPEAVTIRDAIQSQIYRCWNIPAGARNAESLIIQVEIDYGSDGNPIKIVLASESIGQYKTDPFFQAAADSAIRAIQRCAPLENLPPGSFPIWQYINMRFNPKDVLG